MLITRGGSTPDQMVEAVRAADGAVVGSSLLDILVGTLDAEGCATKGSLRAMLDGVRALA
ncbi:hypothetical protein [Roseomonas sp. WA12]